MSENGTPEGWAPVRLASIAEVRLGRQRSPARAEGPHMRPYMRAANVTWQGIDTTDVKEMDFTPAEYETYGLRRGDILLGEASGSPEEVGKAAIWRDEVLGACFQNTLIRVRPAAADLVPFLHLHFVRDGRTGRFAAASRGVGIHHLGAEALSNWEVVLPPLPEQDRIVVAVDSYFTRLDDAVATLERVQRTLKRYRASVLKAAVEGRLVPTEAELARAERHDYEPASLLLERILAERRRWQEAVGRGKYQEPVAPDTTDLPELPEGWCWATWFQIGLSQNGRAFPSKEYRDAGVRLLRPGNLHVTGKVDWTPKNTQHMPEKWATDFPGFIVGPGELIMNLTAQSLADEFLGRICITGAAERCLLNQRIARLTPNLVDTRFLLWLFKAPVFRRFVDSLNTGSLIQHMFTSQLARFVLPLPPAAEQVRIAAEVERYMTLADGIDADIERDLGRCARLRQATLKWAFEGKLADQDPSDEPATALLERIRSQTLASRLSVGDTEDRAAPAGRHAKVRPGRQ